MEGSGAGSGEDDGGEREQVRWMEESGSRWGKKEGSGSKWMKKEGREQVGEDGGEREQLGEYGGQRSGIR